MARVCLVLNGLMNVKIYLKKKVKLLRCDNGKEYLNNRFYKFAKEKGIILNNCPVYVHELNGTAERFNRTIMDMARCLLTEATFINAFGPKLFAQRRI